MEELKSCPSCGYVNDPSRVTCEKCHAKLYVKEVTTKTKDPFVDKKEEAETPKKEGKKRGPKPKVKPAELPAEPSPKERPRKKRVVRRKKAVSENPTFYILKDGKLQAVSLAQVIKPIKKKALSQYEQSMLTLVNRNKSLLNK